MLYNERRVDELYQILSRMSAKCQTEKPALHSISTFQLYKILYKFAKILLDGDRRRKKMQIRSIKRPAS